MTHSNPGPTESSTPTITTVVVANHDDVVALAEWCEHAEFDVELVAVNDWAEPPTPRDLPAGPVHVFAATRSEKDVWEGADRLCANLRSAGRQYSLTETLAPLADGIGEGTTWGSLVGDPVSKPSGRAPKAATPIKKTRVKLDNNIVSNTDECFFAEVTSMVDAAGEVIPGEEEITIILDWAAWEVEKISYADNYALSTVEVRWKGEDGRTHSVRIENIEGTVLETFSWMERHVAVRDLARPSQARRTHIANAIRRAKGPGGQESASRTAYDQFRWTTHEGAAYYVKTDGGVGAAGYTPNLLGGDLRQSTHFAWGGDHSDEDVRAALRAYVIEMPKLMANPDAAHVLLGQFGRGMTPGAPRLSVVLYGEKGNGKTEIAKAYAALMSPGMSTTEDEDGVQSFEGTTVGLEMVRAEFHTGVVMIDDLPPITDPVSLKTVNDAVDAMMRASFPEGATGKTRGAMREGRVSKATPVKGHPSVLLTTEESLLRIMGRESARERALAVEIVRGEEFDSESNAKAFEALARVHAAAASYGVTKWIADQIDRGGGLLPYREQFRSEVADLADDIKAEREAAGSPGGEWEPRTRRMAAEFQRGHMQVALAALAAGAIDDGEFKKITEEAVTSILKRMHTYFLTALSQAAGNAILDELAIKVRSGQVLIGQSCSHGVRSGQFCHEGHGNFRSLGRVDGELEYEKDTNGNIITFENSNKVRVNKVKADNRTIALPPGDVAELLSTSQTPRSRDQVQQLLMDIEGAEKVKMRVNGTSVWTVRIPYLALLSYEGAPQAVKGAEKNEEQS